MKTTKPTHCGLGRSTDKSVALLRRFASRAAIATVMAAMCAMTVAAQRPDLRPINKPGPIIWQDTTRELMTIVEGRERGLLTVRDSEAEVTNRQAQTYVSYSPLDGRIASTIVNYRESQAQVASWEACDPSGSVLVVAQSTSGPARDSTWVRSYDTQTGALLNGRRLNAEVWAVSKALDRCVLVFSGIAGSHAYWYALCKLSTFEVIDTLPQPYLGDKLYFDEHYGLLYSSYHGRVYEFDATTGAELRRFGYPYNGSVRRIRGTDTLFAIGADENDGTSRARFGIIDMTNRKYHLLVDNLSPYWDSFRLTRTSLIHSLDGATAYACSMSADMATAVISSETLAYSRERGLVRYCSGPFPSLKAARWQQQYGYYDPENDILIGDLRPRSTACHSIVPFTTSVAQGSDPLPPAIACDGTRAVLDGSGSWSIASIHDMQGRLLDAPCLDAPCRNVDVRGLPSGSYLCRLSSGDKQLSLSFSIVR